MNVVIVAGRGRGGTVEANSDGHGGQLWLWQGALAIRAVQQLALAQFPLFDNLTLC